MITTTMILIGIGAFVGIVFLISLLCATAWYRVSPPGEAHVVVTPWGKFIASADEKISKRSTYFEIPEHFPFIGRTVKILDMTIKEVRGVQDTIEKENGRYNVETSLKYMIKDVLVASNTFSNDKILDGQLQDVVTSAVRAVTAKYGVEEARAKKKDMEDAMREQVEGNLNQWGLELISFQLVDFKDTTESKIISNISKRREVTIETATREMNAEKLKSARVKEALAEQEAKKQEIERDEQVALREQKKLQTVADQNKMTKDKELEVEMTVKTKNANIEKASAEIVAEKEKVIAKINAEKEKTVAEIRKEALSLEGTGYRLKAEEVAKGDASKIRENGLAEAEAKTKLQEALSKFTEMAIQAMIADKLVEKDKSIGVANAQALQQAKVTLFAGGNDGFDAGKFFQSVKAVDPQTAEAMLQRLAIPNNLGINIGGQNGNHPSK